ncbi:phage-related transcriptional transcriptional regulator [Collimonas arenae]|uniref:Phage-related transcriptional transcriptional regulator n=1 Tax=Collimonas arenae TaxID=279058 RepID=A0A0A1F6L4_9BURK|nr:CII family transcriptional regulator [Collimonas arenae]AIY40161.1 phage-related transcriptional transcriptional regulator [Collimonas arenae]
MSTETVSTDPVENTRKTAAKIESELLRRISQVTQEHAAACMGTSASTISRFKQEHLLTFCNLLAAIGLQVAATDSVVVDKDDQRALKRMAFNWLKADLENDA